ncbi:transporter [Coemansia sp. Benny D115]|nr:transporter [Coemansia sp. Benny D115]
MSLDPSQQPLLGGPAQLSTAQVNQPLALTAKEQEHLRSYIRKCDRRLLLYLCIGYATDSLNKMALANAKIAGLTDDLDLRGYDINAALGAYYLGSFLFQLPSNLLLKRAQPRYWLSAIMFFWSVATIATSLVAGARQLAWCRFLFGAVQAGYSTGSLYYISYWYPRDMVRRRMGFFFASAGIGGIFVGPLCSLLSLVDLSWAVRPWQLIFVVIGAISLTWSLFGPLVLEDYPDSATFISDDERLLIARIMAAQNTVASDRRISRRQVVMSLRDYKIALWMLVDFCANAATQVNGMFGPTIIASQGYSAPVAQALSALTNFMAFSGMASIAYIAQAVGGSAYAIMVSNAVTIGGFLLALFATGNGYRMLALFLFSFASPQPAAHGPSWAMANQQGSTKPAMAAAMTSAVGGLGPLATAFVYRDRDKPAFVLGHSVCLAMTVMCLVATVTLRGVLDRENKSRDCRRLDISEMTQDEVLDLADNHPDFRYKL